MNIKRKLLTISLSLLVVSNAVIGYMSYSKSKEELTLGGERALKNAVHQATMELYGLNQVVKDGQLTKEEAQEEFAKSILGEKDSEGKRAITKEIDLGKNGYLYVIDTQGKLIIHPAKEGENIYAAKDPDGNLVGKMVIDAAKSGNGFSKYNWALPNSEEVAPKIVYSKEFKDWGWVVAAGTYEEDFFVGAHHILINTIIITIVSLVLGITILYVLSNNISRALNGVKRKLEQVSAGDLSAEKLVVKTNDETKDLADSLNRMAENLRVLIKGVSKSSEELNAAAEETASSVEEMSVASERINEIIQNVAVDAQKGSASSIEATKAITYLNELIKEAQERVENGREISDKTMITANSGAQTVEELISRMVEIEVKTEQTQNVIKELETHSQEISKITNTITSIAEQTNLLALNAAIEAARAGEHGKGFAVVADEVRKLSEQSNKGANQVAQLTEKITSLTKQSADSMNKSMTIVGEGVKSAKVAGKSLEEILVAVQETVNEIQIIDELTKKEVKTSDDILKVVENLSGITEKTSTSIEEAAASIEETTASIQNVSAIAEETSGMASTLNESVDKFKL